VVSCQDRVLITGHRRCDPEAQKSLLNTSYIAGVVVNYRNHEQILSYDLLSFKREPEGHAVVEIRYAALLMVALDDGLDNA